MKQLRAFTKKEVLETIRSGKLLILILLFILFGIMNPAIAKLTPWLMEAMSESLAETGISVISAEVDALSSWAQFYKNIPVCTILFLLFFSSILTSEYQRGALVIMVTKGMKRWKILFAKLFVMAAFWTCGYWLCYGITYGYNAYFWDNSIASCLGMSAFCFYLLGLWLLSLLLLMSAVFRSGSSAAIAVFGVFCICYLLSLLPHLKEYLPVRLLSSSCLLSGTEHAASYNCSIFITVLLTLIQIGLGVLCFNRKSI